MAYVLLLVLLSGVLGALSLGVLLLYRSRRQDRARITQLSAELAVQKLTALTLSLPTPAPAPQSPEPVRRKAHLSLYMGGGVAAVLVSFGDQLRRIWSGHRVATATVTVAAASVAAVGAFTLTPSGDTEQPDLSPSTSGSLDEPDLHLPGHPKRDDDAARRDRENPLTQTLPDELTDRLLRVVPAPEEPTPSVSPDPVTGDDGREEVGAGIAPPASSTPPISSEPTAPHNPDEAGPARPPTTSPPTTPQETSKDCILGVELADLDLCVR